MTTRRFMTAGAALGALIAATPALAQADTGPEMTYEDRGYEYAQPAPPQPPVVRQVQPPAAPVTYRQEAVVQPIPARTEYAQPVRYVKQAPVRYVKDRYETEYEYEYESAPAAPQYHPAPHGTHQVAPQHSVPYPAQHHAQRPQFDREAWLDECVDRVRGRSGRGNGGVIGGLVGAAAGGLIGNRVAGRGDRLAGSLIGAGVGGLAGLAIGSAADGSKRSEAEAYCEDYLARYSHGGYGHGYGYQYGYAYHYAHPVMLVPVWVQVPRRAVVTEYVTEEVEEVEVVTYEHVPVRRRVIERAPAPVKRVKVRSTKPRYTK